MILCGVTLAVSNIDAAGNPFSVRKGKVNVKVIIPELNITSSRDSTIDELKLIFVNINTRVELNSGSKPDDSTFLRTDRVSIALRKEEEQGKAY
jgi:hypothetical protein